MAWCWRKEKKGKELMECRLRETVSCGAASSIMRTGRENAIRRTKEVLKQKERLRRGKEISGSNSNEI